MLAFNDIRKRYRRSTLGQFWLTIAMAATIAGIGLVYGLIFKPPLSQYIPFIGVGIIVWGLLSGMINDLATCFIASETYLNSYTGPRSVVVYRAIANNFIVAAHKFLLLPLLLIPFESKLSLVFPLVIPALILIALNGIWVGILIGPLWPGLFC